MSKRFKTISALGDMELVDYEETFADIGESVADVSSYVPISDQVRSLPAGDISLQLYDFPDGKDNGMKVPLARQRGVDLAELSTEIRNQQEDVSYRIRQYNDELQHQQYLESLKQQSSTPPVQSTEN